MDSLEDRQQEMKERNSASNKKKTKDGARSSSAEKETSDVRVLKKRIGELEKQVLRLEAENQRLREQKPIVVERTPQRSSEDTVREQRHNFFKYSNARRY
jgi:hypothetical protein